MKKITLLITLFAFSFGFSQSGTNDCGSAVAIPTTTGTTNYTNTSITAFSFEGGAIGGSPNSSSATWFIFQPTMGGEITVSSCGTATNTALFIGQNDSDCTVSANYSNIVSSL